MASSPSVAIDATASPSLRATDLRQIWRDLGVPVGSLTPLSRLRVRLGQALAAEPSILLLEHPTATLSAQDASTFAADVRRVITRRPLATVVLTADRAFAEASAADVLTLQPGTGELRRLSGWKRWLR